MLKQLVLLACLTRVSKRRHGKIFGTFAFFTWLVITNSVSYVGYIDVKQTVVGNKKVSVTYFRITLVNMKIYTSSCKPADAFSSDASMLSIKYYALLLY